MDEKMYLGMNVDYFCIFLLMVVIPVCLLASLAFSYLKRYKEKNEDET